MENVKGNITAAGLIALGVAVGDIKNASQGLFFTWSRIDFFIFFLMF
jgi:hypothetical protein